MEKVKFMNDEQFEEFFKNIFLQDLIEQREDYSKMLKYYLNQAYIRGYMESVDFQFIMNRHKTKHRLHEDKEAEDYIKLLENERWRLRKEIDSLKNI